ncbi:MAG TPA: glycosyl hydrolase family 17 protein [Armatimonadota bacterium]|nr:glycosyl hydrolase family 17 protein [Armatimonadota bacterium]HOS43830.1 glycosyl hydrolase family 17 protein [Armatimonadota bacterium]
MRILPVILLLTSAILLGAGCQQAAGDLPGAAAGTVTMRLSLASSGRALPDEIAAVSVTVTGPEIPAPITHALTYDAASSHWHGQFSVPSGIDRVFTVTAADAGGVALYRGSGRSDVRPQAVTQVTLHLYADPATVGGLALSLAFDHPDLGLGKIPVCYGPFTTQPPTTVLSEVEIAQQFAAVSRYGSAIRTYTARNGVAHAVRLAAERHIPCWVGIWISADAQANEAEIAAALAVAAEYPVAGLIVGSEVLLRGEQTEAALIAYLTRVQQAANVPVAYADTWNIWHQQGQGRPALAAAVDTIMIHCHPYWEGVRIDRAVASVAEAYGTVKALYGARPVIIGECGWPSAGSAKGAAAPTPLNQRLFTRDVVTWARGAGVELFIFELFDERWKNEPGGVGAHWGLLATDGTVKPEIRKILF